MYASQWLSAGKISGTLMTRNIFSEIKLITDSSVTESILQRFKGTEGNPGSKRAKFQICKPTYYIGSIESTKKSVPKNGKAYCQGTVRHGKLQHWIT